VTAKLTSPAPAPAIPSSCFQTPDPKLSNPSFWT
jgi:hypothetical protein